MPEKPAMRMIDRRRTADIACAPYAGSGKLTDYRKDGSWMMNQIEKGYDKCDRGIKVDETDPQHKRFAAMAARLASEQISVSKSASDAGDGAVELKWMVGGDLDGCSLDELCIVGELVKTRSCSDLEAICISIEKCEIFDWPVSVSFSSPIGVYVKAVVKGCPDGKLDELGFERKGE